MRSKNKQLNFWVTPDEEMKIKANAKSVGLQTGTYLRLLGLKMLRIDSRSSVKDATENLYEVKL